MAVRTYLKATLSILVFLVAVVHGTEKTGDPNPPDGQKFVSMTPILSWKAGINAQWHVIYFDTSFDDVNDAIVQPLVPPPLSYRGYQPVGDEDWDPIVDGGLTIEFETTYYWRIDEGQEELPPPIVGGTVIKGDVWCFTTVSSPIYVDTDAAGANNGSSWQNAYHFLQDALADANSSEKPVEIWVAEGIYKPDQGGGQTPGDRTATFQLINGVTLKGGYAGFGQPDPNARDVELYETILSGDLNDDDLDVNNPSDLLDEPTRAENSYHVVIGSGTNTTAVLDGFTVTGGGTVYGNGGGMYSNEGSPTLLNCTFYANFGGFGGGLYCKGGNPVLTNCMFRVNLAPGCGAGLYNDDSSPTLTRCVFSQNHSHHGGAMYNTESSLILTNCTFTGNRGHIGGGMYNDKSSLTMNKCTFRSNCTTHPGGGMDNADSSLTLTNCTFIGNLASYGAGIDSGNSNLTLTNCTFNGNRAYEDGGALLSQKSELMLTNCTFAGNTAPNGNTLACRAYNQLDLSNLNLKNCILWNGGNEIWNNGGSTIAIHYSDVQGGQMGIYDPCEGVVWGFGNIDADPCFAELGYWEDPCNTPTNLWDDFWVNGDYHLKSQAGRWNANSESWVVDDVTSPCIDAGNPGCPLGDESAPNGNRRNMGTYGGTAEASKSPTYWRSIADLTNDWVVDFNDLKIFVGYWLEAGECIPSDLNRSRSVDFNDFAIFGRQWQEKGPGPGINYQVEDCHKDAGQNQPVASEPNQTRFSVRVEGNNICFEDLITANCCAGIELQMTVEDNLITIYEIEHLVGVPCPCICDYPVTATLGPFEEGNYLVEVIGINGTSLGFVEVTIGGPGITYQIEDCNRQASGLFAAIESGQTRFSVTVDGDYIHFKDSMPANCCPDELEVQMTVEENLVTIYETEYTSEGCRCMCTFPVKATLGPFEPGVYVLEVYQDGVFIGSTTVTIEPVE